MSMTHDEAVGVADRVRRRVQKSKASAQQEQTGPDFARQREFLERIVNKQSEIPVPDDGKFFGTLLKPEDAEDGDSRPAVEPEREDLSPKLVPPKDGFEEEEYDFGTSVESPLYKTLEEARHFVSGALDPTATTSEAFFSSNFHSSSLASTAPNMYSPSSTLYTPLRDFAGKRGPSSPLRNVSFSDSLPLSPEDGSDLRNEAEYWAERAEAEDGLVQARLDASADQQPVSKAATKNLPPGHDLYERGMRSFKRKHEQAVALEKVTRSKAKPQLNPKSLQIAKTIVKGDVLDRLTRPASSRPPPPAEAEPKFKPEINKKSSEIALSKRNDAGSVPSHERLFRESEQRREKREAKQREHARKGLDECTFRPKLDNSQRTYSSRSLLSPSKRAERPKKEEGEGENTRFDSAFVANRLVQWEKLKNDRLEMAQQQRLDPELKECTFKPVLSGKGKRSTSKVMQSISARGVRSNSTRSIRSVSSEKAEFTHPGTEKFLARLRKGRALAEEKAAVPFVTGEGWTPQLTKPVGPKFSDRKTPSVRSLQKPVDLPGASSSSRQPAKSTLPSSGEESRPLRRPMEEEPSEPEEEMTAEAVEKIIFERLDDHLRERRTTALEMFKEYDRERKGYLSREEFGQLLARLDLSGLTTADLEKVFDLVDIAAPDGKIGFAYFSSSVRVKKASATTPRAPLSSRGVGPELRSLLGPEVAKLVASAVNDEVLRELEEPSDLSLPTSPLRRMFMADPPPVPTLPRTREEKEKPRAGLQSADGALQKYYERMRLAKKRRKAK